MYKFRKDVTDSRTGRIRKAGTEVPAGFSRDLAAMVKAGDIELVEAVAEPVQEIVMPVVEDTPVEDAPVIEYKKERKGRKVKQ
jgi:hypothetical protein